MKACTALPMVSLLLLWSGPVATQDAVEVDPSHYKVVLENPSIRVLRVIMPPGAKSPGHQHPDAVVIAMRRIKVRFDGPNGKSEDREMSQESALYTPAGTYIAANIGTGAVNALVVEFKTPAPGKAALPPSRPGLDMKVLSEGPRALVYRTTVEPDFYEPADSKHAFDQLVIALGPTQLTLALQGKPARTTWTRGDVVFIPRGVPHESRNTGGKPADFIMISIR